MTNTLEQTSGATTRVFTLELLKQITNDFSEEHVIGRGAFGIVYRGVLNDGEEIALKKLHYVPGLDDTQFRNEFNNLMRAQHPNITRLVGYCYYLGHQRLKYNGEYIFGQVEERILCLEYLEGGSLDKHISDELCGLDWHTRFKIIKGVSDGLNYLHNGYKDPIYHLDLKPENILLDKNMIPKIGDFGLSRLFPSAKTCITSKLMGTFGYMPPEYIEKHEITSKFDVFSLGVIIVRVIAGFEGYSKCGRMSSQGFLEHVHENWERRKGTKMSLHTSQQLKKCTKIALRCVEVDRVDRPTIAEIVDELNNVDTAESSSTGQDTEKKEHTAVEKLNEIQEHKRKKTGLSGGKHKEQVDGRKIENLTTLITMDLPKVVGVTSPIISLPPRMIGSRDQYPEDDSLQLLSDLQRLRDTLPAMYNLINRATWNSHKQDVAMLLPNLMDVVYDADDLLDEFRWYEMKGKLEGGDAIKSPSINFFDSVMQDNFNKLTDIQGRLDLLSSQLEKTVLCKITPHFDKPIRLANNSLANEKGIFGRDKELKKVLGFLGLHGDSKRKRETSPLNTSKSTSMLMQQMNKKNTSSSNLPVLPIVGTGGVGKTTLAQHIWSHKQVESHFELRIWISVSDDFDVKSLTKEVIHLCTRIKATTDNFYCLQHDLSNHVSNKRILIVLDGMWDDALKENGYCWRNFCEPFKSALEGSMMLVTTRCPKVAEGVQTMEPFILDGLEDNAFWEFFKLCVFGSKSSNNDPELECIGRSILPKLKGSPLAARIFGYILRMDLHESHWKSILESELWNLPQEASEISPATRLSYMYLPFRLKQCFSFCAMYPKDYKFRKEALAEIWVAEGFVDPQGDYRIHDIGCQYFEDLVAQSFFQKVSGGYVMHDLLHDMAQKVSEHNCFILRNKNDFDKVPPNVRHIYVHPSSDFENSNLLSLCRHTKLRTLICQKKSGKITNSLMNHLCTKLLHIRVMSCASTNDLPDSISNLKHLRYLKISEGRPLRIPPSFCGLYNLQILDVQTCKIRTLPDDFGDLRHLQRFVSHGFSYYSLSGCHIDAAEQIQGVTLMKNLNQCRGHLEIINVDVLSKDKAADVELKNKKYLYKLTLKWSNISESPMMHHNAVEVLQVLQPPMSLRSLLLENYPGVSLPSWFLHPDYVPAIKNISLRKCKSLSVPTERFGDLSFLEELDVDGCPNICFESLVSPSLKRLNLGDCRNLLGNIDCCSLTKLTVKSPYVTSIQPQMWSLPALQELNISQCSSLTSIGVSTKLPLCMDNESIRAFPKLKFLNIDSCEKLSIIDGILTQEYLPAIEKIHVNNIMLLTLPVERFGSFPSLKHLVLYNCPHLDWQNGLVLPSSLQTLWLGYCGIFACVASILENLKSLLSLTILGCGYMESIPTNIWRSKLPLLEKLVIMRCPNLVSIGGEMAVANIKEVMVSDCPKLEEAEEIMRRGQRS